MKTAVIYWSGTGNTEAMAKAVSEGAGAELFTVSDFSGSVEDYDAVAFGCPAMGAEVLEEDEFEPFFSSVEDKLNGKKVALFGSYGWGDGEWICSCISVLLRICGISYNLSVRTAFHRLGKCYRSYLCGYCACVYDLYACKTLQGKQQTYKEC